MLVVISFDFGGSSDVNLRYIGPSLEKAREVYSKVTEESDLDSDEENGCKLLVDLLEVEDGFISDNGHTCFWPQCPTMGVKQLDTNNV